MAVAVARPLACCMVSWLPILLFVFMWGIFSAGIARDLPIGVVDLDHSALSRQLTRDYDASPTMAVTVSYGSVEQGSQALRGGDIYALVVIPSELEKDTLRGMAPTVTAFYNSQFILIGKLINSAVMQAQGTLNAKVNTLQNMAAGVDVPLQALGQAVPVQSQITPLYNSNSHYGQFLLPAIIPAMWQIAIVITTIMALSAETRRANGNTAWPGQTSWLVQTPIRALVGKLLPYTGLFMLQGALFLWGMYVLLGWPMHGHWSILLLAQCLMVLACQGMACLLYLVPLDATKAMSFAAGLTAPAFAFVGVTFPATDMPGFALFWRALLPATHYLDVQIHQVNHGQDWYQAMPQLAALLVFGVTWLLAFARVKQLATSHAEHDVDEKVNANVNLNLNSKAQQEDRA
ncbi:ABC-type multidrug transport system permease component [Photobacterium aphoticum]|uniref:ABC-type multidrug transport system permease component n=1 Tax=Photobacterium aphoticum TaxID=754436 RepID=A0A090QJ40_9GAMM|nr:ABC-type multidrug transport system permease component [Photobacterium aphoticum]